VGGVAKQSEQLGLSGSERRLEGGRQPAAWVVDQQSSGVTVAQDDAPSTPLGEQVQDRNPDNGAFLVFFVGERR
jgi:hypothetical protein